MTSLVSDHEGQAAPVGADPDHQARHQVQVRRLRAGYFGAGYLEHGLSITVLTIGAVLTAQNPVPWMSGWGWIAFSVLLAIRLLHPIYEWVAFRFGFDERGVSVHTGLVNRRVQFVEWRSIVAVQVDAQWNHRLCKVAEVKLLQGGEQELGIVIPGLDLATVREMVDLGKRKGVVPGPAADSSVAPVAAKEPSAGPDSVVYRATTTDLLRASLVYGNFLTLGVAGGLAVYDGLERLNLTPALAELTARYPVVVGGVVAVVIAFLGAVSTVVRFCGLETAVRDDSIILRYGLIAHRERVVSEAALAGVEVRRNPLELLSGRARLTLVSTDSAARLGSNLVLPSLLRPVLTDIVEQSPLRRFAVPDSGRDRSIGAALVSLIGTLFVSGLAGYGLVTTFSLPWAYGILAFLVVFAIVCRLGKVAGARLRFDEQSGMIDWQTSYVSHDLRILDRAFVHVVTTWSVRGRPILVRLHFYAGRPRVLTSFRFQPMQVRSLAQVVGGASKQEKVLDRTDHGQQVLRTSSGVG